LSFLSLPPVAFYHITKAVGQTLHGEGISLQMWTLIRYLKFNDRTYDPVSVCPSVCLSQVCVLLKRQRLVKLSLACTEASFDLSAMCYTEIVAWRRVETVCDSLPHSTGSWPGTTVKSQPVAGTVLLRSRSSLSFAKAPATRKLPFCT